MTIGGKCRGDKKLMELEGLEYEGNRAFPTVFFAKIIGDDQFLTSNKPNNASGIKKLVINFFDQKILKNIDIKSYFDDLSNHKILIR